MMDEEGGAINVFEAVIAAMIIVSALLYWNVIQRPDFDDPGAGDDYNRLAGDVLGILVADHNLVGWLDARMADGHAPTWDLEGKIENLLPQGIGYALRVETGAGSIHLAPDGAGDHLPRAGGSASTLVSIDGADDADGLGPFYPGQGWDGTASIIGVDLGVCDVGPVGDPFGASDPVDLERWSPHTTWAQIWNDAPDNIPAPLPYGTWSVTVTGAIGGVLNPVLCPNAGQHLIEIGPPAGDGTAVPPQAEMPYLLQLVVWPGG